MFFFHFLHFLWLFKWWTPKKEVKLILSFTKAEESLLVGVWRLSRVEFIAKLQNEQLFCWSTANDIHSKTLSHCKRNFMTFSNDSLSISLVRCSFTYQEADQESLKSIFSILINIFDIWCLLILIFIITRESHTVAPLISSTKIQEAWMVDPIAFDLFCLSLTMRKTILRQLNGL